MKISIMMITWERFEITKRVWEHNTKNLSMKYEYEFLIADQGSKDQRIIEYFKEKNLKYHRLNSKNEGVGKTFNQLYLRSTGDIIVLFGNDLLVDKGWEEKAVEYLEKTPRAGIAGITWGHGGVPPLTNKFGLNAHWLTPTLNRVFGVWFLKRSVIEDLGFFCEEYGYYGLEDSDVNERVNRAGYNSFYIPGIRSQHLGHDVGELSEYRKMKDKALAENLTVFTERMKRIEAGGTLKCILPEKRAQL